MARYEEALRDFDRAIELEPEYEWAIAHRGLTYRLMAQYAEALRDFDRAIELEPDDEWAVAQRGLTYRLMAQYAEALRDLDRAIELKPDDDWSHYNRGLTYKVIGEHENAMVDFSQAITLARSDYETNPQDWRNTFNLAVYHLAGGHTRDAERLYREGAKAPGNFIRGAITDLGDLLHLFPDHAQAHAMRTFLQEALGN